MAEHQDIGTLLGEENDVIRRMQLAKWTFQKMFWLFAGIRDSLSLKVRLMKTFVYPVLLYECGTWGLTVVLTEKLRMCTTQVTPASDGRSQHISNTHYYTGHTTAA